MSLAIVDFPEPEGPTSATVDSWLDGKAHVLEHGRAAVREPDVAKLDSKAFHERGLVGTIQLWLVENLADLVHDGGDFGDIVREHDRRKSGPMIPSESMATVMKEGTVSDPSRTSRHPTGSTPMSTAGHTLIMIAVHGSIVRLQSIMRPEFALTESVNFL